MTVNVLISKVHGFIKFRMPFVYNCLCMKCKQYAITCVRGREWTLARRNRKDLIALPVKFSSLYLLYLPSALNFISYINLLLSLLLIRFPAILSIRKMTLPVLRCHPEVISDQTIPDERTSDESNVRSKHRVCSKCARNCL